MTIEATIVALLNKAAPLRLLSDEEQEAKGLRLIVDEINALRAGRGAAVVATVVEGADVPAIEPVKRKAGRPKKAAP